MHLKVGTRTFGIRSFVVLCGGVAFLFTFVMSHQQNDSLRQARIESMYGDYKKYFPQVKEISAEEIVQRRAKERMVFVDVRTDAERAVSVIPGAISESEFEAGRSRYLQSPVVVYCTIGYRSGLFVKNFGSSIAEVYNLKGGVLAWAGAGQEFLDANGNSTRKVHVYGRKWNLLPPEYSAVW